MQRAVKLKKCRECKKEFTPVRILQKACSPSCAIALAVKQSEKLAKRAHKARKDEMLSNDASFQKSKAQKAFNEFIRLRDRDLGCISCDKPKDWGGQWHAGHYKTVGARADLRFNEDNCHKQCVACNNYLSGNLVMYRAGLIAKIGIERVEALELSTVVKRSAADYAEIAKHYQSKIKELKCKEV
jgi:hypothetical protein